MPSPVVVHAVPDESSVTPRRPHAPPLPALNVITLCFGSSRFKAATEMPAYVFAIQSVLPSSVSDHPLPVWNM